MEPARPGEEDGAARLDAHLAAALLIGVGELDPTLTQLSNEGGTTTESVTLGNLVLVNGTITYLTASTNANAVPTLGEWGLIALMAALAVAALRFRL